MDIIVDKAVPKMPGAVGSIQEAINQAKPGDTILVMPGEYTESVDFTKSGTPGAPITLKPKVPNSVGIRGEARGGPVIDIRGKSHISIRGLRLYGGRNGVAVDPSRDDSPSSNIVIEGNYITKSHSSGIRVADANGVTVWGNTVEKTNQGGIHEMISIIGTTNFVVRYNTVFNGTWVERGVPVEGKEGIDIKDGSRDGAVDDNHVYGLTRLGIYIDAWDELTTNIVVRRNRVHHCKQGLAIASEAGGTVSNVLVENNSFTHNVKKGIILPDWQMDGPRQNITIIHNTVTNNGDGGIAVTTRNASGIIIQNNLTSNNGGAAIVVADPISGVSTDNIDVVKGMEEADLLVPASPLTPLDAAGRVRGLTTAGADEMVPKEGFIELLGD